MNSVKKQFLDKKLLGLAKRREFTDLGEMTLGHNKIKKNKLELKLADIWGFCYGVLYALEEVGKILEDQPEGQIWVLGDLIHNPLVNRELKNMGAKFVDLNEINKIQEDDTVVIPAFGTKKQVLKKLENRAVRLINTTCPEVKKVEEKVREFNRHGYTAIIHGKYAHQESIATSSYALKYLIVKDYEEAKFVTNYMLEGGDKQEFQQKFNRSSSTDFDPETDLKKVGMVNQTTMLMNESLKIFNTFKKAIQRRDGDTDNYRSIETICSATQDRQDAVKNLLEDNSFDLFIVVGGHNSSNTQNLALTVAQNSSTDVYHLEDSESFTRQSIRYLPPGASATRQKSDWLPGGEVTVGITAGASTPHSQLEAVLEKLLGFY